MDPNQLELVQTSLALLKPHGDQTAALFYRRLFKNNPSIEPLFRHVNMEDQRRKFMSTLSTIVQGLDRMDVIAPIVDELGKNHVAYGATAEHYGQLGQALSWALGETLGEDFSDELRDAWDAAYETIADRMKTAANY